MVQNAKDPTRIEIVFGIDEDDVDSARFVNSVFKHVRKKIISFKPIGYVNLHKYINTLAAAGQGKWLFIWNDDALMRTENWDEIILTHGDENSFPFAVTDSKGLHVYQEGDEDAPPPRE